MYVVGDTITCTPEHPFFVNNEWVAAKKLKAGDMLLSSNSSFVALDSLYEFKTDTAVAVYNLEASGNHNYYVSASKVLVHNCGLETHHLLPKQFNNYFQKAGLNIEEFTLKIPKDFHRLNPKGIHTISGGNWNNVWKNFIINNPSATKNQILIQLSKMFKDFGIK